MIKLITACILALFATINLNAQIIHPGPNPQLWSWAPCGTFDVTNVMNVAEAFALGDIYADGSTIDEGDDYLEDNTPVCAALTVVNTYYQTKVAHHVKDIIIQQGSSIDVAEEWVVWVRIWLGSTPSSKQIRIKQQYDKHAANGDGNKHGIYPVDLVIPAGSWIQITRPAVACVGIPSRTVINPVYNPSNPSAGDYGPYNQNNCITGQSVTFVGTP